MSALLMEQSVRKWRAIASLDIPFGGSPQRMTMTFLDCIPHQADPHSENDDEISSSGSCPPSYTISETRYPARVLCVARKAEVQYGKAGRAVEPHGVENSMIPP